MEGNFRARRQRIEIQRRIETRNTLGEVITEFEHSCTTWAEINGDTITIRYKADLMPGWRALLGDEVKEIIAVVDIKKPTRLVRLTVKKFSDTGRRRFCPAGQGDEQQTLKAFAKAEENTSE